MPHQYNNLQNTSTGQRCKGLMTVEKGRGVGSQRRRRRWREKMKRKERVKMPRVRIKRVGERKCLLCTLPLMLGGFQHMCASWCSCSSSCLCNFFLFSVFLVVCVSVGACVFVIYFCLNLFKLYNFPSRSWIKSNPYHNNDIQNKLHWNSWPNSCTPSQSTSQLLEGTFILISWKASIGSGSITVYSCRLCFCCCWCFIIYI